MKRSLRLPFSILLLLALCSLLSIRGALRRSLAGGSFGQAASPAEDQDPNATLFRLSSLDPYDATLRRDVDGLLDGRLPPSAARGGRFYAWPRENYLLHHHHSRLHDSDLLPRANPRFSAALRRSHKDYLALPEFRRALRDWFRRRRFQPSVMSELVGLVKRPLDLHRGLPDPGGRRYGSCAVVGNSGILLKEERGQLIDSHELVIRLNNARTEGYRRHVGSRTGLSFINSNILHLCARREGCHCHPYGGDVPIAMYICQAAHFLDFTLCNASHKAPLLITDPRFDLLCARIVKYYSLRRFTAETGQPPDEWAKAHDELMFHYSSGMQAVVLAVGICDQVSVFGFGKVADAKHHYHTNQKAELDLHDYEAEYAFYRDLVENPQAIPFLTDSGFKVPRVVFRH